MNNHKSCLYILNKASNLNQALAMFSEGDALLLIEDAVSLCTSKNKKSLSSYPIYVLNQDLIARGLTVRDDYQTLDYAQFVELSLDYKKSVTVL